MRARRVRLTQAVSDPAGATLFKMRNKKAAFHRRFICEDEWGAELFRVQRKFRWCESHRPASSAHSDSSSGAGSALTPGDVLLHATVPTTVGDAPTLQLLGSNSGTSAEVTDLHTGELVATVAYSYRGRDLMRKNKEEYCATVAAGVDLSVVVALCLAWDQSKEDDTGAVLAMGGGG